MTSPLLSPHTKLYFAFLCYISGYPTYCKISWYGEDRAAELLGISRASVTRAKKVLRDLGLIRWARRGPSCRIEIALTPEKLQSISPFIVAGDLWLRRSLRHRDAFDCVTETQETLQVKQEGGVGEESDQRTRGWLEMGIEDSLERAEEKAARVRAKRPARKFDRRELVAREREKRSIESWKGTKFFQYLVQLCQTHAVPMADNADQLASVPRRYSGIMNKVLDEFRKMGLDNPAIAGVLEKMTEKWPDFSGLFRDRRLSLWELKFKAGEVLTLVRSPGGGRIDLSKYDAKDEEDL